MNSSSYRETIDARNSVVKAWFKSQMIPLRAEVSRLGIKSYSGQFKQVLSSRTYTIKGVVTGGGFRMPRHAIFVHKGVGRGYPIEIVGESGIGKTRSKIASRLLSQGYNKRAIAQKLSVSMAGKENKKRKPKPWFNPIIDRNISKLADDVMQYDAEVISKNIFIK